MLKRLQAWARRRPSLPLWLLVALLVVSTLARLAWIAEPCRSPCRSSTDHILIFDEDYYVNAARVIDRITPPTGAPYANSPLGTDPNSEHPPLAKLIIAGGIELFGDGPIAWRLPSVLLGTVALLGIFALVRWAGGSRWTALGAAALMAADNLLLVHSRIGTLDIYATAAMIWAAALYLRGRPVLAGVVIGVGACAKEVTPYVLFALVVLEVLRWIPRRAGAVDARAAAGGVRDRVRGCVRGAARRARPDRAPIRPADGQARARPAVRGDLANSQLRRQSDEPARAPGDRLVPVGLAGRHQADHLPADQPGPPDRPAEPDRAGGALPRPDQPADPAARDSRDGVRGARGDRPPVPARATRSGSSAWPGSSGPTRRSC